MSEAVLLDDLQRTLLIHQSFMEFFVARKDGQGLMPLSRNGLFLTEIVALAVKVLRFDSTEFMLVLSVP